LAEQKKTVSAKQVVADIRAGATDEFLMKKYGLTEKSLQSVFQQLVSAKVLTQDDLDHRKSPAEEVEVAEERAPDSPKERSQDVLKEFGDRFKISKEDLERLKTASLKDIKQLMDKYNTSLNDSKELLKTLSNSAGSFLTQAAGKIKDRTRKIREEIQQRQPAGEKEDEQPFQPPPSEKLQEFPKEPSTAVADEATKSDEGPGHSPQAQPDGTARTSQLVTRQETDDSKPQEPPRPWYENKSYLALLLLFLPPLGIYGLWLTSILPLWSKSVVAGLAVVLAWRLGTTSLILWAVTAGGLGFYYLWRRYQLSPELTGQEIEGQSSAHLPKLTAGFFPKLKAVPSALAGFSVSLFTGQFLLKVVGYLVVLGLFALSVTAILQKHELSVLAELESLVHLDPVPKTKELQKVSVCAAIEYLEHFMDFDYVKNNSEAVELFARLKEERASLRARSQSMLESFWKGTAAGACPEDMLASTVSDMTGVGSFRTLYEHYTGKEMSDFTLWLARIDTLLTTVTVASGAVTIVGGVITFTGVGAPVGVPLAGGGGAATATAGVGKTASVFLKTAHRLNKVPAPFQKELVVIFKEANKLRSAEPLKPAIAGLQKLWGIKELKGAGQLSLISRAKSLKELDQMVELAGGYGKNTVKFLELGGDKAVAIYRRHGNSKLLTEAMNTSIQYGEKGTELLFKTGPEKFMKGIAQKTSKAAQVAKKEVLPTTKFGQILHTVGISKYTLSVRGFKSFWEGHLTALLLQVTKWVPQWVIFSIAACSGIAVIGIPALGLYRAWQWIRTPA
jgi:hypothetical protein